MEKGSMNSGIDPTYPSSIMEEGIYAALFHGIKSSAFEYASFGDFTINDFLLCILLPRE
nr:MAG TPA: hypothetical protein [Caudoviricetes sp.]